MQTIQKFNKTDDLKHVYKNELDKAHFSHDAAYSDSKDSAQRTISDKILKDKAYEIAVNPKDDGYQRGLASTVYKVLTKNGIGSECKRRASPRTTQTSDYKIRNK